MEYKFGYNRYTIWWFLSQRVIFTWTASHAPWTPEIKSRFNTFLILDILTMLSTFWSWFHSCTHSREREIATNVSMALSWYPWRYRWNRDAWKFAAYTQIAKAMRPTWGPPGSCRPQMGPILAPWTLLSGISIWNGGTWVSLALPLEWGQKYKKATMKVRSCVLVWYTVGWYVHCINGSLSCIG